MLKDFNFIMQNLRMGWYILIQMKNSLFIEPLFDTKHWENKGKWIKVLILSRLLDESSYSILLKSVDSSSRFSEFESSFYYLQAGNLGKLFHLSLIQFHSL